MKAVVALSGGMDSATVLAKALDAGRQVEAVSFRYGSKHNDYENRAAEAIAHYYKVPFDLVSFISLGRRLTSDLLKSGGDIPEGHYEDQTMKRTVVPCRNLVFISALSGIAWSRGAGEVWLGIHAGDHAIYPDCRPDFFKAMRQAVELGTANRVELVAPFLHVDKGGILKVGLPLGVPYHLTRTCYKDQQLACGKCGACQERIEAFGVNAAIDPIAYEER